VRATGAEIRNALGQAWRVGNTAHRRLDRSQLLFDRLGLALLQQPVCNRDGNLVRLQRAPRRKQRRVLFILLADDHRRLGIVAKLFAQLGFKQRALFLDHDDLVEPAGKLGHDLGVERPHHCNLQQPQAELRTRNLIDAKVFQRLAHIEITLAGRHDADLRRLAAGQHDLVQLVGARKGNRSITLVLVQAPFLLETVIAWPDVQPVFRHLEIGRILDLHPVNRPVNDTGRFDIVVHALQADPAARIARQCKPVNSVIENFLQACRMQDRDHRVHHGKFGLVRHGRAFRAVIVTHQGQHAAVFRGAGRIGMAEHVACPVNARALAVPDCEYAVISALAPHLRLLRAPDRGRRHVLVHARLELHVGRLRIAHRLGELLIQPAHRRATIPGHIPGGIQPAASSRARCISVSRTIACVPVMKA
jgi:hypothetical protein